jgi:hypothetical protein
MPYEFRRGVRDKTSVIVALAGASGSGKTYTAILMAVGLAYPGMSPAEIMETIEREGKSRIAFIDTEGGRGLHYCPGEGEQPDFVDTFPIEYSEIVAPYTPEAYKEAIEAADKEGFHVVIIDSASHEYESEGGIQEMADEIEAGVLKAGKTMADADDPQNGWKAWATKPVKSPGNWKEPKKRHKKFVNRAIQSRAHLIFCLRAEEKMLMRRVKKSNGNREWTETEVVPAEDRPLLERWVPICEKRFMFEMTVSFLLLASAPGVGHPIKNLQAKFVPMFPEGQRIGIENGRLLAEWSHGRKMAMERDRSAVASGSPPPPSPAARPAPSPPPADPPSKVQLTPREWVDRYKADLEKCKTLDQLDEYIDGKREALARLESSHPDLHKEAVTAGRDRRAAIEEGRLV